MTDARPLKEGTMPGGGKNIWYCAEYFLIIDPDSGPSHCGVHRSNAKCQQMRLVSVDALVVEKVDGEWPVWALQAIGSGFSAEILDALAEAQPFPPAGGGS